MWKAFFWAAPLRPRSAGIRWGRRERSHSARRGGPPNCLVLFRLVLRVVNTFCYKTLLARLLHACKNRATLVRMLKAFFRWIWPPEPEKTQQRSPQLELDLVSRAEFDAAIQKLEHRIEWDLSEWYDKFSTLHARTAKRAQRQQKGNGVEQVEQEQAPEPRRSVLAYRKPWSV